MADQEESTTRPEDEDVEAHKRPTMAASSSPSTEEEEEDVELHKRPTAQ